MSAGAIIAIVLIILIVATIITIPILCSKGIIPNCPGFATTPSSTPSTTTGSTTGSTLPPSSTPTVTQPPAPAIIPSSASTAAPITYIKCADEGGNCTTTLPFQLYAYTSGDPNLSDAPTHYKILGSNVACNNNIFGDPQAGTPKKCYSRIIPDDMASLMKSKTDISKDSNWALCAQENQICNIPSDKSNVDVLYGVNGMYNYANVSKPVMCNYTTMSGNPLPNIPKSCFYRK